MRIIVDACRIFGSCSLLERKSIMKKKSVNYGKWGYIFILPFFVIYFIFSLIPLFDTVRYSFFEYFRSGIKQIGPNFIGLANYVSLLHSDMLKYGLNTLILWVIGFVPQIVIALVLACWFTDARLKLHGKQFFKVVIYLPNLIMASAFALLFFYHVFHKRTCKLHFVFTGLDKGTD